MSAIVSPVREPLILGNKTYHQITEDICRPTETTPSMQWIVGFLVAVGGLSMFAFCVFWTIWNGIGSWNLTARLVGVGISPISFGGLVLVTPVHSSPRFFYYFVKSGEQV